MAHPSYARVLLQKSGDLYAVLHMSFNAQRYGFDGLQQHEGVERREHGAHVALIYAATAFDVGAGPEAVSVYQVVVRLVRPIEHWKSRCMFLPRKMTAVDNAAAHGSSMPA